MADQKKRKEAAWKSRKQEQHPHGKIKSLKELSSEMKRNLLRIKQETVSEHCWQSFFMYCRHQHKYILFLKTNEHKI